jgi:hypothetical protein
LSQRWLPKLGSHLDFLNNCNLILLEPNEERKKAYFDAFRDGAISALTAIRGAGSVYRRPESRRSRDLP